MVQELAAHRAEQGPGHATQAPGADDAGDRDVATADSPVRTLVIRAREEEEIAREVRRIVA